MVPNNLIDTVIKLSSFFRLMCSSTENSKMHEEHCDLSASLLSLGHTTLLCFSTRSKPIRNVGRMGAT